MLISWFFSNDSYAGLDSFILAGISLSIIINLRQIKSKILDINKWRMSLDNDNNFNDIFMIMIDCARKFHPAKPSFKYSCHFYSYNLRKFREDVSFAFSNISEWSMQPDIKTFLQAKISRIINNFNDKLTCSLKNNKKRINIIYIKPPLYSEDIGKIFNKTPSVKSVKFIGDAELEYRINEKENTSGLDKVTISHHGVLKYLNHDSYEIDRVALLEDFVSFLKYAKNNQLLEGDTKILLEADVAIKHLLVATLNRELKAKNFKNTVFSYYESDNGHLSDRFISWRMIN